MTLHQRGCAAGPGRRPLRAIDQARQLVVANPARRHDQSRIGAEHSQARDQPQPAAHPRPEGFVRTLFKKVDFLDRVGSYIDCAQRKWRIDGDQHRGIGRGRISHDHVAAELQH